MHETITRNGNEVWIKLWKNKSISQILVLFVAILGIIFLLSNHVDILWLVKSEYTKNNLWWFFTWIFFFFRVGDFLQILFPGALKLCSKKGILNVPIAELWLPIINKFLSSNRSYNIKENIFRKIFLTFKIKKCIQAITSQHLKIRNMNLQLIWENKEKKFSCLIKFSFCLPWPNLKEKEVVCIWLFLVYKSTIRKLHFSIIIIIS